MNYASLRQEGIRQLERLAGPQWTDFNAHDPGVTLLEQVCFALADLGYRTAHDVPDLLAEAGASPYQSLHRPEHILTCRPVTPADLRRLALDVEGVQNAWVEPLGDDAPLLYYDAGAGALSLTPGPLSLETVPLRGLYRVLIDPADGARGDLKGRVARRLHSNRGLCEDFAEVTVLSTQPIELDLTAEIGPDADADPIELEIMQKVAEVISPPVSFRTLEEMVQAGLSLEAIFDGPLLERGFVTDDALERATRRVAIYTSDIVRAVRDVVGVRAVSHVRVSTGGALEAWSLAVAPGKVAKLDRQKSSITLRRAGKPVNPAARRRGGVTPPGRATVERGDVALPPGRDRHVATYASVRQHLPTVYGVGDFGLPATAPPDRAARALQLRAYLMFFDQLMANHLAQLAHVKDLFSHEDADPKATLATYFAQPVDQAGPPAGAVRACPDEHEPLARSLAASRHDGDAIALDFERKNRFLNHLLARFAETLDEHDGAGSPERVRYKQAFLRQYPRLGAGRGAAFDYLEPAGADNRSELERRVELKLGLAEGERPLVVEHLLLRPLEGDEKQEVPLLSAALSKDPYSLQLTFVFPATGRLAEGPGGKSDFRALVEQTVREETPAHLTVYIRWMAAEAPEDEWYVFEKAYWGWLARLREHAAERLGLGLAAGGEG